AERARAHRIRSAHRAGRRGHLLRARRWRRFRSRVCAGSVPPVRAAAQRERVSRHRRRAGDRAAHRTPARWPRLGRRRAAKRCLVLLHPRRHGGEGGGVLILLVEDSPDDEALIVHALEDDRLGPVTVTRDGAEALDYLRAVDETAPLPDVVLLDMNLPRVKGLDVLRPIRDPPKTRQLPLVILPPSATGAAVAR